MTDDSLMPLGKSESLRALYVNQNPKVTADGVKKLAAALPHCQIVWDGGTVPPKS